MTQPSGPGNPGGNPVRHILAKLKRLFSARRTDGDPSADPGHQRSDLQRSLERLNPNKLRRLLALADRLLAADEPPGAEENPSATVDDTADGEAYRAVARQAFSLARAIGAAANPVARIAPFRELAWLKESIAWHAARRAPGGTGATSMPERLRNVARVFKYANRRVERP